MKLFTNAIYLILLRHIVICHEIITQLCSLDDTIIQPAGNITAAVADNGDNIPDLHCDCNTENSQPWGMVVVHIRCQDKQFENKYFEAEKLPLFTEILDISWNSFEFVPNLVGSDLIELDVSHNSITAIDDDNFVKIKQLKILILSSNKIDMLSIDAFAELDNLKKLDLSRNLLTKITTNVFSKLPVLEHLILSYNRNLNETFSVRDVNLYITLGVTPKLKILEIEKADLTALDISHGVGLEELYLKSNLFDAAPNLPKGILVLDLSDNTIINFGPKFLPHLRDLHTLYLRDMPNLTNIQDYALFGLPNLRTLSFESSWNLAEFSAIAFGNNVVLNETDTNLEILNLRGSNLQSLNESLSFALENIKVLDLNGNPITCDCDVKWLLDKGIETNAQCIKPIILRGKWLSELTVAQLKCRRWPMWVYKTLNGLLVLLLLVLCGVALWLIVMGIKPSRKENLQKIGALSPYARVTIEPNRAEDFR